MPARLSAPPAWPRQRFAPEETPWERLDQVPDPVHPFARPRKGMTFETALTQPDLPA
ncbi:hypothetical protein HOE425_330019 [Hoeflea sp. EC-HK425]|nr:hypothetical protein HOE425_330019 [Hoeflea sp. EC-HK425]